MATKFRRRSRILPEISYTPLIDCAFTLLIFFAVAAKVSSQPSGIAIKSVKGQTAQVVTKPVEVAILAEGESWLYFNGNPVQSVQALESEIKKSNAQGQKFLVKPEPSVSYERLMEVMDSIRLASGKKVDIALFMEKSYKGDNTAETGREKPDER